MAPNPSSQLRERPLSPSAAKLASPVRMPGAKGTLTLVTVAAVVGWSAVGAGFDPARLAEGIPSIAEFMSRLWPPDFSQLDTIVRLLIETLQMAVIGTLLGALLSLVVSFGAANNIAPAWLYACTRGVLNVLRSIPELIFALMFVSAVGLGPFAGILAIILGSVGTIGKVYAEAMESVDAAPPQALTAAGASRSQVVAFGILPQASPLIVSYTLLLFEGNVRGATILGLVGAGGIGLELTTAMQMYDFGHLSAIVISIIVLVTIVDRLSALIRRKLT